MTTRPAWARSKTAALALCGFAAGSWPGRMRQRPWIWVYGRVQIAQSWRPSETVRPAPLAIRVRRKCAPGESRAPIAYSGVAASVWLDGRLVRRAGADARGCGVGLPGGGQVPGGGREAEDRHVAVDSLVFAGPDLERLVPDPDVA